MPEHEGTPRAVRISFEFNIHPKIRRNIQRARVEKAVDTIADRVVGLAEGLIPWAGEVVVRKEWLYTWVNDTQVIDMPATDENTTQ